MSAKKWMQWLSVIALILATVDFIGSISDIIAGGITPVATITIFLLAIVLVIISFKKDNKK